MIMGPSIYCLLCKTYLLSSLMLVVDLAFGLLMYGWFADVGAGIAGWFTDVGAGIPPPRLWLGFNNYVTR